MNKSPYLVLGVDKSASQEDINKAFRSLAARYHPDRNPENPKEAAERFKEVASAYEILGDANRRKQYDFYEGAHFPSFSFKSRNGVDSMFDNLFSQFFGKGARQTSAFKSRVRVTLAEAFSGCSRKVLCESHEQCKDCVGTGSSEWSRCSGCDGSGFLFTSEGPMRVQTACSHCSGRGSISKQGCRTCNGRGQVVRSEREVEIKIPAGIEDGTQIRLSGEGPDGSDLFVVVNVERHPSIERQQRNLFGSIEIPYHSLILGGEFSFGLFGSDITVKVPPLTRPGSRLRVRGQGMPHLQNPELRGDLFIEVGLKMPSVVTPDYEKAMSDMAKLHSAN